MLFSQRKGLKPVKSVIQKNSVDDALRHGLWDALHLCIWQKLEYFSFQTDFANSNLWFLFQMYWHGYFKRPLDNLPDRFHSAHQIVRDYVLKCEWFELYDFIEFTAKHGPDDMKNEFINFCNNVLEREMSAYRFIGDQLTEITSDEEITSIESALKNTDKLKGAHQHLEAALALMSDRKNPDFRNSIKEAISAVESLAQTLTGDAKATLGAALKTLEKKSNMHPALKSSLSSLYGYTSDASGIRHAMLDESKLSFNDAKFMLVACTAFVNYLVGKAAEEGIKLV
ncbi:hypothetical protein PQR46_07270 [Paraburkholderia sediminicola]|uniref:AbiJ-NTD4 domain-containing protein n=1 Tax=Paraburkholderia sediminicola TaxID=458836 RepID=UPI0038BC0387